MGIGRREVEGLAVGCSHSWFDSTDAPGRNSGTLILRRNLMISPQDELKLARRGTPANFPLNFFPPHP